MNPVTKLPHVPSSSTVHCHICELSITLCGYGAMLQQLQGVSVLGCQASACCDYVQPRTTSHNVIGLISQVMYSTALKDFW